MFKRIVLPLLTLLLFAFAAPTTLASTCFQPFPPTPAWVLWPSSNYLHGATSPVYSDSSCTTVLSATMSLVAAEPAVRAGSRSRAIEICQANIDKTVTGVTALKALWFCQVSDEPYEASDGEQNGSGARVSRRYCPADINLPLDGLRLHAFDGMESGIIFQRRNHCAVGVQEVIDMGFLDAVDVWSNIGSGYSVCFPQPGRIVFLDAATSPRIILFPEVHHEDEHICASLTTAGLLVLVEAADDTSAESSTQTRRPGTDDSIDDAIALEDCTVTPRVNLRLRESPWGAILAVIPRDSEVPAMARTENWFNLTYEETEGWSAAWLVDAAGDCDWSAADE